VASLTGLVDDSRRPSVLRVFGQSLQCLEARVCSKPTNRMKFSWFAVNPFLNLGCGKFTVTAAHYLS